MKILVVEDQIGDLMLRILRHIAPDAKVVLAYDGVEGLSVYREFEPDLVISDWNMPRMNGGNMAAKIREIDSKQKIILWSGSMANEFYGYSQFFNRIVQKDILMLDLQQVIAGVMDESLESAEQ